jgi:phosphatidylinositol alpha-1,6-mannosyltransferase
VRILYISHTLPPQNAILENEGGMQRVSRQLVDQWKRDSEVELFTEAVNVSGRGLVGLQTASFLVKLLIGLPRKASKLNADLILFSSMVTASLAFFLRNRIDLPMVTINHGRDVTLDKAIYQKFLPYVFTALDGVISVSKATRLQCIQRGMKPEGGVALANGFDLTMMNNLPDKEASRTLLKSKFDIQFNQKKVLLTVGRQVKRKGHDWFIRKVFSKLPENVLYLIIGDGSESGKLKKLVQQKNLQNRIFMLGRQPDQLLKLAYRAADIFIMPNIPVKGDMEGFGLVLLEANLAETFAVASELEGIKDVVMNGRNGYAISPMHSGEFAETIRKLLDCDLEQCGKKARRYVQQNFGWEQVSRNYLTYLRKVASQYGTNQPKKDRIKSLI